MATSAEFQKGRSTPARRAYAISATADEDVEVRFPNTLNVPPERVQVEIEPAGPTSAAYLASDWKISAETTQEEIVLVKSPAQGSGAKDAQALAFVSDVAGAPAAGEPEAAAAKTPKGKAKPKAKK